MNTRKVNVPVLWDANDNFKNGETYSVSAGSIIVGIVSKPTGYSIPGYPKGDETNTLQIKDPTNGTLFLNLTYEEYIAIIGEAEVSPDSLRVYNWVGGVDIDPGSIVTDPRLDGITIQSINKGGVTIYHYTHSGTVLNLTEDGGLAEDEHIQIFYTN